MSALRTAAALSWSAVLAAAAAGATPEVSSPAAPSVAERIDAVVAPYLEAGDFRGVVAFGRDGEAPLLRPYGLASIELGVAHRADGIFAIGSISKQFTAAAILLLEEDGRLATGDPVSKHLPGFAHGEAITIEQLLTHTAGVADVYSLELFGRTAGRSGTFEQVIEALGRAPLTHRPGEAFAYSNGGYSVLAAIVERASGMAYGDFLARRVFAPLGLESTYAGAAGPARARRVPGYDPWGRRDLAPALPIADAFGTGSGSLWSSAADLLAWSAALHGGRLLSPASYAKLTRGREPGYGYGVSVFDRFDRRVIGHDGRIAGFASDLARYLDERLTVVVLSNVQSVARDEIRRGVAAAVLGEDAELRPPPTLAAEPVAGLDELAGEYAFGPAFTVSIAREGNRLLARANLGGSSELVPAGDGGWFSRVLYASVRFGRDETGSVDRLIWGRGDGAPTGRRVR